MKFELTTTKERLQNNLMTIEKSLSSENSHLEPCNYIITNRIDEDTPYHIYTVATDENKCLVVRFHETEPQQFTEKTAKEIIENYHPKNGWGEIDLIAMTKREFLQDKIHELKNLIKNINEILRFC